MRPAEWLAGLGGLAALASLLWGVTVLAVLTALTVLPALALPIAQAARHSPAVPVLLGVLTASVGVIALIVALVRLAVEPGTGAWLGFAGALGALAGGWLSMRAEHLPGARAPVVPRRPAPPSSA